MAVARRCHEVPPMLIVGPDVATAAACRWRGRQRAAIGLVAFGGGGNHRAMFAAALWWLSGSWNRARDQTGSSWKHYSRRRNEG